MAAQDAELKLKVSLDLAFFRQQLTGLGQAAAGYKIPVQIQFDRRSVQNELNKLSDNFRRRTYRLTVETNLSAEIEKADTLARKFTELSGKIKAAAGGAFSQGPQGAAGLERFMREQGLTGRAFGVQQSQERIARQAILSRLEKGSLSKGGYNIAGLEKIIRDLGGTPTGGRRDLALQAKKLVEEADGIADAVFEGLKDLQMKLRPIRGQAQTSAARSMPNLNAMLDRMAILTSNPRAAQRMLRMMPESRISTNLIGVANRQAAFQEQYPQGFKLPGFNAPKAFDPLLKAIAKDFADYARTVNSSDPWVGKVGNGIANIVAKAANAPQAQKLLPGIGGTTSPINVLEARLAAARGGLGAGGGMSGLVQQGARLAAPSGMLLSSTGQPRFKTPTAQPSAVGGIFATGGVPVQGTIPGLSYRMNQFQFPSNGMMGPSSPLGQITAKTSMFGGGGFGGAGGGGGGGGGSFFGGMGGFGRAAGGLNLPGTGTIRELGQEFSFAAKQVLLFGTAYKALAFITDFPTQVSNAVGKLQTFNNTLAAISPTAKEAAASNQLILDLVNRYNIPLQSARDGFTKLYASMQPAGFGGEEIRNLFTGISKAAATFGMSADKVDRVNYAFAQMASKGQVMSEELKGQLGDVLPGAMAIFAQAAGFKGPKAIQDFSAALEDGRYKGVAMVDLLNNVSIILNTKFSEGAEGAAKTFQGAINNMQTSLTLFYQAFEPAAVQFLNVFVSPISSQLKTLADGFNAFFKGTAAKTSGGMAIAKELENLKPSFEGILSNLKSLIPTVQAFGAALGMAAKFALSLAADPLVGYLARMYPIVYALTTAFGLLRTALISNIGQFLLFNIQVALGMSRTAALRGTIALTGTTAAVTTGAIRGLNLAITSLGSRTIVGVALVGLSLLIEKFVSAGVAAQNAKQKMLSFADSVKTAGQAADVGGLKATLTAEKQLAVRLKDAQALLEKIKAGKGEVTTAQAEELKALGIASNMTFARQRGSIGSNLQVQVGAPGAVQANIQAAKQGYGEAQTRILQTQNALNTALKQQVKQETELTKIREGEDDKKGKRKSLEDLIGGDIERDLNRKKAELELDLAIRARGAGDDSTAKRMIEYYGEYRNAALELQAVEQTIEAIRKQSAVMIKLGLDPQEKLADLENQRVIINTKIATIAQKQYTDAEKAAKEQDKKMQDRIKKQQTINRLIEDAQIKAGIISPQQALILEQRRGFADAQLQAKEAEASPEQLAALSAAQAAIPEAGSLQEKIKGLREELQKLASTQQLIETSAASIGDAFANSFKQAVTGAVSAQEALSNFFESLASAFSDMAAEIIKKMIQIYILNQLVKVLPGGGGGFNANATSATGSGLLNPSTMYNAFGFANGGVVVGGFKAFADGGVVQGPTLGLVGEGRYNEAVVPLPDGKSIPVELGGAMGGTNITVNVDAKGTKVAGDQGASQTLARDLAAVVDQRLVYHKRAGGLLSR